MVLGDKVKLLTGFKMHSHPSRVRPLEKFFINGMCVLPVKLRMISSGAALQVGLQ